MFRTQLEYAAASIREKSLGKGIFPAAALAEERVTP
jgi:hypothetical protein